MTSYLSVDQTMIRWLTNVKVDGKQYSHMLGMTWYELENTHNFIQKAFPTDQRSVFHPEAPVLNRETLDELKRMQELVAPQMLAMAQKMLSYYERNSNWMTEEDHNLLRISRIIRSLNLVLNPTKAEWFYHSIRGIALRDAGGEWVPEYTLRIWEKHCHPSLYYTVS